MKQQVAEIALTEDELACAVSRFASQYRLNASQYWNSYSVNNRLRGGGISRVTVRFYMDEEVIDERTGARVSAVS